VGVKMTKIIDQPSPKKGKGVPIWNLVIADISRKKASENMSIVIDDMKERDKIGFDRYGTRLFAFNGRNALIDAYQEFLDAAVYLRQRLEESYDQELLRIYNQHLDNLLFLRGLM
jgi:hypothetical protein